MTRRRAPANSGLAFVGTVVVHAVAGVFLFAAAGERHALPPTYRVRLVAAPAPDQETRRAPEAFDRPAAEPPAPAPAVKPLPKSTVSRATPPPNADRTVREAAPRTTPNAQPLPGERPSTGGDPLTVSTEGVEFPFPEYTQNIVVQIARAWKRPLGSTPLEAEIGFLIHRDGSISDMSFIKRSLNFEFDVEAQGAIEFVGRSKAFGPLPPGWPAEVLFVRFYFSGKRQ